VWTYATGQREAERAGQSLESAGGALERATESFEPVVQQQRQKELVKERACRGPSMEL